MSDSPTLHEKPDRAWRPFLRQATSPHSRTIVAAHPRARAGAVRGLLRVGADCATANLADNQAYFMAHQTMNDLNEDSDRFRCIDKAD